MKLRFASFLGLLAWAGLFAQLSTLRAQPAPPPTHVLELDGTNSYVELPPKLFTNAVVTVEGWVKWREFGTCPRFFDFGDASLQININLQERSLDGSRPTAPIQFEHYVAPGFDDLKTITLTNLLPINQWVHLAVVVGANFSKLYVNGVMLSANEVPNAWRPIPLPPLKNFLGRSVMGGSRNAGDDTDLNGQMAEVRIWDGECTAEQIRTNLFTDLTGREASLLAPWNFADGTARDASGNGHDGKLIGNARVVAAQLPAPAQLRAPAIVFGTIKVEAGKGLANATIRLLHQDAEISTAASDTNGNYSVTSLSEYDNFDLAATVGELALEKYRKAAASLTVLIIEDDASTREMLRRALQKEGWRVAEATNGRAGLAELAKQTPALILLDLMMPEMDGFEFMEELRHGANPSRVPVIVITAKDLTEEERRRLNGGVERIIQKRSSTREQMPAEVRAILAGQNNKQA